MRLKHYLAIFACILLLAGCGDDGNEGIVGEYQSARAEAPAEDGYFEYTWSIIEQPDASRLIAEDLELNEGDQAMSFIPDYPGSYEFEVVILDEFGDELSTQNFQFEIIGGEEELVDEDDAEIMEDTIEEPVEDFDTIYTPPVEESYVEPEPEKVVRTPPPPPKKPVYRKPAPPPPGSTIPKDPLRYTIQVSAKRTFENAQNSAEALIESGYDAYIQKAYFKETDEIWYRVRVGSFESYSAAVAIAANISESTQYETWVDHIRLED